VANLTCQTPRSKIIVASSCGEANGSSGNNSSGDQLPHTLHDTTTSSQQPTAYSDAPKVVPVTAPVNVSTEDDVSAENDFEQVVSKKKKQRAVIDLLVLILKVLPKSMCFV